MCSFVRYGDLAGLVQADRPRCSWRQIDVTAPHKGSAIIDPHNNAAAVAHPNERAKRQGAVSRGHCRTIETFSVGGATAAQAVTTAINACNFRTRELTAGEQQRSPQKQFHIAREQTAHIATPRFRAFKNEKGSTASPNRLNPNRIGLQLTAKFRRRCGSEINDYGSVILVSAA
jgi:hypothetical protein